MLTITSAAAVAEQSDVTDRCDTMGAFVSSYNGTYIK
jgi:hypothetical protein